MLYVTHGNDRISQKTYIKKLRDKNPNHQYVSIERTEFSKNTFQQVVFGSALFGESYFVVLDGVTEILENREYLESRLKEIENAGTIVVIQDSKLSLDFVKKLHEVTSNIIEYKEAGVRPDFSLWSAFYARNKKSAWQAYLKISKNDAPEKIHAGLLGQVRSMYKIKIAKKESTWKDLGFAKDTSYNQARVASEKFSEAELAEMLYVLTDMFGNAHAGETDFKLGLEVFLLKYI